MATTPILCPECFKAELDEIRDPVKKNRLYCPKCGTHFIRTGERSVIYE